MTRVSVGSTILATVAVMGGLAIIPHHTGITESSGVAGTSPDQVGVISSGGPVAQGVFDGVICRIVTC